jgi:hypothetical protein
MSNERQGFPLWLKWFFGQSGWQKEAHQHLLEWTIDILKGTSRLGGELSRSWKIRDLILERNFLNEEFSWAKIEWKQTKPWTSCNDRTSWWILWFWMSCRVTNNNKITQEATGTKMKTNRLYSTKINTSYTHSCLHIFYFEPSAQLFIRFEITYRR